MTHLCLFHFSFHDTNLLIRDVLFGELMGPKVAKDVSLIVTHCTNINPSAFDIFSGDDIVLRIMHNTVLHVTNIIMLNG